MFISVLAAGGTLGKGAIHYALSEAKSVYVNHLERIYVLYWHQVLPRTSLICTSFYGSTTLSFNSTTFIDNAKAHITSASYKYCACS
jgi:ABC-type microcin C transport system permease subunit YejB